jgi:hypothetical protein
VETEFHGHVLVEGVDMSHRCEPSSVEHLGVRLQHHRRDRTASRGRSGSPKAAEEERSAWAEEEC